MTMTSYDSSGFNAKIEISESGRRYVILRYGRVFIAKLIEEMYTDEVFNSLAAAYAAKFLSRPEVSVQETSTPTTEEYRDRDLAQPAEREEEGTTEIPRRAELKLPVLELLAQGPKYHSDIIEAIAELYDLSTEERKRVVNSDLPIFEREVWGAKHLLKEEGLVDYPSRGEGRGPTYITERGLKFLEENS